MTAEEIGKFAGLTLGTVWKGFLLGLGFYAAMWILGAL